MGGCFEVQKFSTFAEYSDSQMIDTPDEQSDEQSEEQSEVYSFQYREAMNLPASGSASSALLDYLERGGVYFIPEGEYLITQTVRPYMSKSLDVLAHPNAVFRGDDLDGILINPRIDDSDQSKIDAGIDFIWRGGKFDVSDVKTSQVVPYSSVWLSENQGDSNNTDALGVRGTYGANPQRDGFNKVSISGAEFYSGEHWQDSGGDTHIGVIGSKRTLVFNNTFIGARDLGVYLSGGDDGSLEGHYASVYGNSFINCFGSVSLKRGYKLFDVSRNIVDNSPMALGAAKITSPSGEGSISNNILRNCGIGVTLDECVGVTVENNTSHTTGWVDSSGLPPTTTYNHRGGRFQDPIAVLALGASDCIISNNKSINRNPLYVGSASTVVLLKDGSANNLVSMSSGVNVHQTINEAADCVGNQFLSNTELSNDVPSSYLGAP